MTDTLSEIFSSKLAEKGECWVWTPQSLMLSHEGVRYVPRRLAYILTHGEIPAGQRVLVNCGTVECCNPAHLELGAASGGRRRRHALTKGQMISVRKMYASGKWTQTALAKKFRVNQFTISRVVNSTGFRRGLDDAQVRSIRQDGRMYKQIGKDYGIKTCAVYRIKRRTTYTDVSDG